MLFFEEVGVSEHCCRTAVESRLEALRFVRSPRATRASRATNPRPNGLVGLDSAQSRQSYGSGVGTQPRTAKATAGVAVVGKNTSIPCSAAIE